MDRIRRLLRKRILSRIWGNG